MTDAVPRTLDEYRKAKPAVPRELADDLRNMRLLRQAEVSAENLTGDPKWDVFLSYLQHLMDATALQREAAMARLNDPRTVAHDEMMRLKILIAECSSRIDTLQATIALPATLKETGRKAKDIEQFVERLQGTEPA